MANEYVTVAEAVARNPSLASINEYELERVLTASSRWIDGYCSRKFWLDEAATVRVFRACDMYLLDLGEHEIGASSPVTVKTDDGTGTFATTVSASAYQLEPVNAAYAIGGARPYTSIRALSTSWPITYTVGSRQELVQVTAKFGWPSVPDAVRESCLALTVNRIENPTGVRAESIDGYSVTYAAGYGLRDSGSFGSIGGPAARDVAAQLAPYRRAWAA